MESTINAIFAILGTILAGAAIGPTYRAIKTEVVLKVHRGLPSRESYTRKLTGVTYPATRQKHSSPANSHRLFSR